MTATGNAGNPVIRPDLLGNENNTAKYLFCAQGGVVPANETVPGSPSVDPLRVLKTVLVCKSDTFSSDAPCAFVCFQIHELLIAMMMSMAGVLISIKIISSGYVIQLFYVEWS